MVFHVVLYVTRLNGEILLLVFCVLVVSLSGCGMSQVPPDATFGQLSNYHETQSLTLQMQQHCDSQTVVCDMATH